MQKKPHHLITGTVLSRVAFAFRQYDDSAQNPSSLVHLSVSLLYRLYYKHLLKNNTSNDSVVVGIRLKWVQIKE